MFPSFIFGVPYRLTIAIVLSKIEEHMATSNDLHVNIIIVPLNSGLTER